eukprot:143029-Pleurochrysis_carterae.AAC.1
MPVGSLAPTARGPLVAPLFVGLRSRALRVGGLGLFVLLAILFTADSESVRGTGIGFQFAPH